MARLLGGHLRAGNACALAELRTTVLPCALALVALTALGAAGAHLVPALGPRIRPHRALHPTLAALASILVTNARVLAAPFILIAARFPRSAGGRRAGDAIIATILTANAARIGLAIGAGGP
jgi:hypothetical protein